MKVKSESDVAQLCLTLRDPVDCSLPGSSVHGIFQARVLEWGAIAFSEYENSPRQCLLDLDFRSFSVIALSSLVTFRVARKGSLPFSEYLQLSFLQN